MRENYANFLQIAKLAAGSKILTCNKKANLLVSMKYYCDIKDGNKEIIH